jgi:hypothetical protein
MVGGNLIVYNFVETLIQMFVVDGNEVGSLVQALHFVGVVNQVALFLGVLLCMYIRWWVSFVS